MHTLVRFFHFRSHFLSLFLSIAISLYIYISVICSFIHSISFSSYHSHSIYLSFYPPSLSHFSMIQRSSRGSNLVSPRIQKRLTRQFPRSYAHFTKNWRVSRHCDESARRKRRRSRKIIATYRRNDRRRPEDADSGISNKPVATRHSFRSGDRIGPRVAAATYIIILIMIIILEIGAPHNARDDDTRSSGIP